MKTLVLGKQRWLIGRMQMRSAQTKSKTEFCATYLIDEDTSQFIDVR